MPFSFDYNNNYFFRVTAITSEGGTCDYAYSNEVTLVPPEPTTPPPAPPQTGPGGNGNSNERWVNLETVTVPADGTIVTSSEFPGVSEYLLVADGHLTLEPNNELLGDAEYAYFPPGAPLDDPPTHATPTPGINYGILVNNADPGWGAYNDAHDYSVALSTTGPMSFQYSDNDYPDNSGVIPVMLYGMETLTNPPPGNGNGGNNNGGNQNPTQVEGIKVADSANAANYVTAVIPQAAGPVSLFVPENSDGSATLNLSGAIAGETDWSVSGNSASPASGTFSSTSQSITVTDSGNKNFVLTLTNDETGVTATVNVTLFAVIATPYRTGENFGTAVSQDVIQGGNSADYVILTEDGAFGPDLNDSGQDTDLAQINLTGLPTGLMQGTFSITTDDPGAVAFLSANPATSGDQINALSVRVGSTHGYLSALTRAGTATIWMQGLQAEPDLKVTIAWTSENGSENTSESFHVDVVSMAAIDADDSPLTAVTTVSEETLLDETEGYAEAPGIQDTGRFQVAFSGLESGNLEALAISSSDPAGTLEAPLSISVGTAQSNDYVSLYDPTDGTDPLTDNQKAQIKGALQLDAIESNGAKLLATFLLDAIAESANPQDIVVSYVGGASSTNGTKEQLDNLANHAPYIMKGYMLQLGVDSAPNSPVTWSITKTGQPQQVGTFYNGGSWLDYGAAHQLAAVPNKATVYWRSDFGANGSISDQYTVKATYISATTGQQVTSSTVLKSRLLDPNDPKVNASYSPDADMAQRALIQDFYLDKGRLSSYRPGIYDDAAIGGYYTSSVPAKQAHPNFAAVADEVSNFDQFALNDPNPTQKLTLAAVTGIWSQFGLILAAPAQPNGVTSADPNFQTWVNNAIAAVGGIAFPGFGATPQQLLTAQIQQEGNGRAVRQSWTVTAPLAQSSIDIGQKLTGSGNSLHTYTDGGIGFTKVQPYNANGQNLYDPSGNLAAWAAIFQSNLGGANPGGGDISLTVWYALFKYNFGNFGSNQTPSALRSNPTTSASAAYADGVFNRLSIALPS